jgi:hypothetical protein
MAVHLSMMSGNPLLNDNILRRGARLTVSSLSRVANVKRVAFLMILILGFCAVSPRLYGFVTVPLRVRFTGVLLLQSKDQSRKGALEDFQVLISKEKWTFLLDRMEIVGSVGVNRVILQRIFPPLVRFVGPDDLIDRLKSPKMVGHMVTLEGFLYPESRMFLVTEIDEAATN